MKRENLARSTRPYKIMCTAILSFFISWTPYHVWYGMTVEPGKFPETILEVLMILTILFTCIDYCLTPILYLFIVESFKNIFKKSLVALIELVLNETNSTANRSLEDRKEQERASFVALKDVKEEGSWTQICQLLLGDFGVHCIFISYHKWSRIVLKVHILGIAGILLDQPTSGFLYFLIT